MKVILIYQLEESHEIDFNELCLPIQLQGNVNVVPFLSRAFEVPTKELACIFAGVLVATYPDIHVFIMEGVLEHFHGQSAQSS
jgi:hypothetical protein